MQRLLTAQAEPGEAVIVAALSMSISMQYPKFLALLELRIWISQEDLRAKKMRARFGPGCSTSRDNSGVRPRNFSRLAQMHDNGD
jgi:hypothetical protein